MHKLRNIAALLGFAVIAALLAGCGREPIRKHTITNIEFHGKLYMAIWEKFKDRTTQIRAWEFDPSFGQGKEVTDTTVGKEIQTIAQDTLNGRGANGVIADLNAPRLVSSAAASTPSSKTYLLDLQFLFQFDSKTSQVINQLDLATPPLAGSPSRFKVTSDGSLAVISNLNRPNQPYVLLVDLSTFTIAANIPIPENANAYGVAITPDNKFAYIVTESLATAANSVYIVDLVARKLAGAIPLPNYSGLTNIAMTPDGTQAYLNSCCGTDNRIPVIDIATNTLAQDVSTIYFSPDGQPQLMPGPAYMAMHPNGTKLYLAPMDGSPIRVLDTSVNLITKFITVPKGDTPWLGTDPVFTPDGGYMFVLDAPNAIAVIDTTTDTFASTLALPSDLAGNAISSIRIGYFFVPDL